MGKYKHLNQRICATCEYDPELKKSFKWTKKHKNDCCNIHGTPCNYCGYGYKYISGKCKQCNQKSEWLHILKKWGCWTCNYPMIVNKTRRSASTTKVFYKFED